MNYFFSNFSITLNIVFEIAVLHSVGLSIVCGKGILKSIHSAGAFSPIILNPYRSVFKDKIMQMETSPCAPMRATSAHCGAIKAYRECVLCARRKTSVNFCPLHSKCWVLTLLCIQTVFSSTITPNITNKDTYQSNKVQLDARSLLHILYITRLMDNCMLH